ncbi:MAG: hypothetical protein ABIH71_08260, partial [Candidatus Omnitrophota bacterium]
KTLEEPPSHVKFIFATTHPQKVLPTILSRCQRFQFNLISLEEIVSKLKKIVLNEKIEVEDSLFYEVARAAGGSIRDAESLLDQIIPVILDNGSVKDVLSFLGVIDEDTLNKMITYFVEKDLTSSLDFIDKLLKEGKDLGVFIDALLEHLRNFLLAKVSIKSFNSLLDLSPRSKDVLLELSEKTTVSNIIKFIDSLITAKDLSRKLNTVRIPLELAIIKATYDYKEETDISSSNIGVSAPGVNDKRSKPILSEEDALSLEIDGLDDDLDTAAGDGSLNLDDEDSVPVGVDDDILCRALKSQWPQLLSNIQKVRAAISSHLSFARPVSSQGSLLRIAFSKKEYFHKEIVEESKKLKVVEELFSKFIGKSVKIKFIFQENTQDFVSEKPQQVFLRTPENKENVSGEGIEVKENKDDAFINDLLDAFGGQIATENE